MFLSVEFQTTTQFISGLYLNLASYLASKHEKTFKMYRNTLEFNENWTGLYTEAQM